jgi:8-oxo-dGTP diphosphatase
MANPTRPSVFFAGHLTRAEITSIRFGDEGQGWEMMPIPRFLTHPRAVPELQRRTGIAWADLAPS